MVQSAVFRGACMHGGGSSQPPHINKQSSDATPRGVQSNNQTKHSTYRANGSDSEGQQVQSPHRLGASVVGAGVGAAVVGAVVVGAGEGEMLGA